VGALLDAAKEGAGAVRADGEAGAGEVGAGEAGAGEAGAGEAGAELAAEMVPAEELATEAAPAEVRRSAGEGTLRSHALCTSRAQQRPVVKQSGAQARMAAL
jgi:hypothetical protein